MSMVLNYNNKPKTVCALFSLAVMILTPFTTHAQVIESQRSTGFTAGAIVASSDGAVDGDVDIDLKGGDPVTKPEISDAQTMRAVPGYEGCEIVLIEPVAKGASLASYRPADDFIESIYDDAEGFLETVDSLKVRAVMCTRDRVIPQLRDFPILASGVHFSISNNFDSHDSQFMTVFYKAGTFQHKFSGPTLTEGEQIALRDVMEIYNLQDHDLDAKTKK